MILMLKLILKFNFCTILLFLFVFVLQACEHYFVARHMYRSYTILNKNNQCYKLKPRKFTVLLIGIEKIHLVDRINYFLTTVSVLCTFYFCFNIILLARICFLLYYNSLIFSVFKPFYLFQPNNFPLWINFNWISLFNNTIDFFFILLLFST